jgi:microcystin-dependent protein
MLPLVVQVRDRDLNRIGVLSEDDLTDFQLFPAKNDVGTWSLTLPHLVRDERGKWVRHRLGKYLATPGAGISVALPGGRRFSGPMLTPQFEESTSDPGGTWTYTGVSDLIVLADRAAFPDPAIEDAQASSASRAYDVRTGKAESIMRQYVSANIGPDAPAGRRDARITLAPDLGRGGTRTKSVRFSSLLELMQELAIVDGLLFDLVQVGESLEFRIWEPADLTGSVRMDIASDQLASTKFSFSPPAVTKVIVLGQGEAEDRVIRTRTTTPALEAAQKWGRVIERVIDQRQTDDVAEMDAAGDELLTTDGTEIQSLEVTPSDVNARQLGVQWWIGDVVTVNAAGVPVKADIAKVRVSVGPDGIFAGATVGDPIGFDADRVTNARVGSVESRVSSLERNGQSPSVSWANLLDKPSSFPSDWSTLSGKPLALPPLPQNSVGPTTPATAFALGVTTVLVEPASGWANPNYYGTLITIRSYLDPTTAGGTVQYWSSYQGGDSTVYYRQWFYQASTWSPWSSSTVPAGTISQFAGSAAPVGYVFANGQGLATSAYPVLFGAIGYTYGGSGGTFNVPNLNGRVPVGLDGSTEFGALGRSGGSKTHTLSGNEMPYHSHTQQAATNAAGGGESGAFFDFSTGSGQQSTGIETSAVGGSLPHNNLQPYIALNFIIKT